MKRIDLIYNTVKNLDNGDGITTLDISKYLNLERSNVSKDLNILLKKGKLFKNNSRPVKYFLIILMLPIFLRNPQWIN
jgi:transcriptional regulator with AAA-type ATPase domain